MMGKKVTLGTNTCIYIRKEIQKTQNVIIAYYQRLKSYFEEINVKNPILEKPHVWSPIIANFSNQTGATPMMVQVQVQL